MNKVTIIILIILIIWFLIFLGLKAFAKGKQDSHPLEGEKATYRKISAEKAKEMMDSGVKLTILDVRTPGEFAEGHVRGAINIANETIGSSKVTALPDLDATILVYCRSGARSAQASKKLVALGYTGVLDFGGIINWPFETVR